MILFACKLLIIKTNCCQGYAAGKDILYIFLMLTQYIRLITSQVNNIYYYVYLDNKYIT